MRDLAWFNSGMRIKYDRTCQGSIKIISIEKNFVLHKSAHKKHFFLEFFLTKALDELYLIIQKLTISKNGDFFTLDDTSIYAMTLFSTCLVRHVLFNS